MILTKNCMLTSSSCMLELKINAFAIIVDNFTVNN